MLSTAECLFFVLDQSTPTGNGAGGNSARGNGNSTIGGSGSISSHTGGGGGGGTDRRDHGPGPSSSITPLAPILAAVFLDIVLSYSTNTSDDFQNIQWTFWELAKVLLLYSCRHTFSDTSLHSPLYLMSFVYFLNGNHFLQYTH